jgi:hypothetical protein
MKMWLALSKESSRRLSVLCNALVPKQVRDLADAFPGPSVGTDVRIRRNGFHAVPGSWLAARRAKSNRHRPDRRRQALHQPEEFIQIESMGRRFCLRQGDEALLAQYFDSRQTCFA